MRIVCPNCEATYDVRDDLLRPGRATKCARCGERWVPLAELAEVAVSERQADVIPSPAMPPSMVVPSLPPVGLMALDRLSQPPSKTPVPLSLKLAWAGSMLVLITLVAGVYVGRGAVVAQWPPSLRLYAALGLTPGNQGTPPIEPAASPPQHGH